jgi:protein-tyrosine phosphatase
MSGDPTGIKIAFDPTRQRMTGTTKHGFMPFDEPFISEITPGLWQGGCKNGLILPKFIKHVVSLYRWEEYKAKHDLASTLTVRMIDGVDQETGMVDEIARWVNACRKSGPTAVHCQAGLNRSSLVVARALMLDGMTADAAITLIREKRSPACLCNPAFEEWLRGLDSPAAVTGAEPPAGDDV